MTYSLQLIMRLLQGDSRYKLDAYQFIHEGMDYAHEQMGLGRPNETTKREELLEAEELSAEEIEEMHVDGRQLCEALRLYALEQYGYMAKLVLNRWGVHSTDDFGELVFHLIDIGALRKSKSDRREDFIDIYDFDQAFQTHFKVQV